MSPRRIHIPTLRQRLGDATQADFKNLGSPLSERTVSHGALGEGETCARPDLVTVVLRSATLPRTTRRKLFSGRVRKR